MRVTFLSGLVGSAFGLVLLAPAASAQHARFQERPKKVYSIFDRHPFKKYVGPTICGEACLGYFPTQWAQWEHVCPGGVGCDVPVHVPDAGMVAPAEVAPVPTPKPMESTPPKPATPGPKSNTNATPRTSPPSLTRIPVPPVRVHSPAIQPVALPPGLSDSQFAK